MSKKPNSQDLAIRNLHAQKKVNAQLKEQLVKLKERVAAVERALRYVLKYARVR